MRGTTQHGKQPARSDGGDLLQFQSALMRQFYRQRAIRRARRAARRPPPQATDERRTVAHPSREAAE